MRKFFLAGLKLVKYAQFRRILKCFSSFAAQDIGIVKDVSSICFKLESTVFRSLSVQIKVVMLSYKKDLLIMKKCLKVREKSMKKSEGIKRFSIIPT